MSHVITEKCLGEVYAACIQVCPTDSIHTGTYKDEPFTVIDPETCIDCGVCLVECPVGAIVGTVEESPEWAAINKELTPTFKSNPKPAQRPTNEAPRKPGNKLVK